MKNRMMILATVGLIASSIGALAATSVGVALPGDRGRMGRLESLTAPPPGATAPAEAAAPRPNPPKSVPEPSMELALKAAQAIAAACKQYLFGMAIVDSAGGVKLIYIPDASDSWHGYHAVRKAYTAVTFKMDTSKVIAKAHEDPAIIEQFRADPNLETGPGGLVLMAGGKVIGAIGVSGAVPGGHDEECGNIGRDKIKYDLK